VAHKIYDFFLIPDIHGLDWASKMDPRPNLVRQVNSWRVYIRTQTGIGVIGYVSPQTYITNIVVASTRTHLNMMNRK